MKMTYLLKLISKEAPFDHVWYYYELKELTFSGILGVDCSAAGNICLCGRFHLCGRSQGICHGEHLDLLCVLRHIFCVRLCH